jgi:ferrous iron transport protein A
MPAVATPPPIRPQIRPKTLPRRAASAHPFNAFHVACILLAKLLPSAVCYSDQNGRILKSDYSGRSSRAHIFVRLSGVRQLSVLSDLKIGETGVLVALDLPESVQNHLMHMGFVPDALVTALRRAPAGDPTVYAIDGMEIALRTETAHAIRVRAAEPATAPRATTQPQQQASPKDQQAAPSQPLAEALS